MDVIYVKGSELPVAESIVPSDFFIMVIGGQTKSFSYERLAAAIAASTTITGPQIVTLLEALTGDARLNASSVKNSIEVLSYTKNNGETIVLPARTRLMEINLISANGQTVRIGTSAGNDEILEDTALGANKAFVHSLGEYFMTETTLHFTTTEAVTVEIVKYSKS